MDASHAARSGRPHQARTLAPALVRRGWQAAGQAAFKSKSAAWAYFRDHVEPELSGEIPTKPDLTLSEFVVMYLERHSANVRPRTIGILTERLRHAERSFGKISLRELERMSDLKQWIGADRIGLSLI